MGQDYPRFRRLDGRHPFRSAVPGAYVDYAARRRRDGEVVYFNFALAKEMGLIPARHPLRLNPRLRRALLDTFGLVIINEYDLLRNTRIPARDALPHRYMATRYLQLQHPGRQGRTSGDGRSIWNGSVEHRGVTWDVSSCGTGVTCLCPATAQEKTFFRTGSPRASYGCGTAALDEGLSTALMSEAFHRNGIATERVLAVIALPSGLAIHVRAGRNLLRPSHLLVHLKQNDLVTLRAAVDYFIDRQVRNGDWPHVRGSERRYRFMAKVIARTFARTAATFESEYVFCWLDWDGDNVLADGGIIDYGSVRQFGLYHREYRFDDVERMSTTIPEQRQKARYIVQNFAQIRDFLLTGSKPPLAALASDPVLALFDAEFEETRDRLLLRKIGLESASRDLLMRSARPLVERFRKAHRYFERARAARGPGKVPDGLNWNAVFCTRDLLCVLPQRFLLDPRPIGAAEFIGIAASSYASRRDRALSSHRRRMAREFQRAYLDLIHAAARNSGLALTAFLARVAPRAALLNRRDRITGNGVDHATAKLIRARRTLSSEQFHRLIERFVEHQNLSLRRRAPAPELRTARAARIFDAMVELVEEFRYGL